MNKRESSATMSWRPLTALWMGLLMTLFAAAAARSAEQQVNYAPDVVDQFNSLARRGDGLAFGLQLLRPEVVDTLSLCKHIQGVVRVQAADGTPYLIVSQSGNDPGPPSCPATLGDDPGTLYSVRMGSRDTHGERLRSNRLMRDWFPYVRDADGELVIGSDGQPVTWTKPPDPLDTVESYVSFHSGFTAPDDTSLHYGHPGGMQVVGDVLAVPLESPYDGASGNRIVFFDVADPASITVLSHFEPAGDVGLIGLTPVLNDDGPGLRYLLIVTGGRNEHVRLYRSLPTPQPDGSFDGSSDLKSPQLGWEPLLNFSGEACYDDNNIHTDDDELWPVGGPVRGSLGFQTLNFVREGGMTGPLYLIGTHNTGIGGVGDDYFKLYRMQVDEYGNPLSNCPATFLYNREVTSYPFNGHGDSAALSAGSGVYVSPSGELIIYATEYHDQGPYELRSDGTPGYRSVRVVEWRHTEIVREGSPTLDPTVVLASDSRSIDEGSSTTLIGIGGPSITKAWIQLFEDSGLGRELPDVLDDDDWLQIDYDDRTRDHFEDLLAFDQTTGTEYWENAGSWRWFAPVGCTISVNDYPLRSANFPGPDTVLLHGTGEVMVEADLDDIGFDDDVEGVTFFHVDAAGARINDCDAYYNAPIELAWDLDGDSEYETYGANAPFSAVGLDGPAEVPVSLIGIHPMDGRQGHARTTVTIRNVAPIISRFTLQDSLGLEVGSEVPFTILGLPITVRASFTDPGTPDRQSATLWFDDGTATANTAMNSFSDAYGGATGALQHSHLYAAARSYSVQLGLRDDDGDTTTTMTEVRVLTPRNAVTEIIDRIAETSAETTNRAQRAALRLALLGLEGVRPGSGVVALLERPNIGPALLRLGAAIILLEVARVFGAELEAEVALLRQVVTALRG